MARRFTIGRDRASDIAIADDSVSRTHAEIWLEADGSLMLADRGSSNGTELIRDGFSSAIAETPVTVTDHVRFGTVMLGVRDMIDTIEAKHPGALTAAAARPPLPPPLPAPPMAQVAVPLPPPPPLRAAAAPQAGMAPGPLVRCECGAIKSRGSICPGCHR